MIRSDLSNYMPFYGGGNQLVTEFLRLVGYVRVSPTSADAILAAFDSDVAAVRAAIEAAKPVQPPTNTASPTITGTAKVGSVLTANNGTWTGSPTFKYQWLANAVNVAGATSKTYTPVAGDVGKVMTVSVTGTNSAGNAVKVSAATAAVAAAD